MSTEIEHPEKTEQEMSPTEKEVNSSIKKSTSTPETKSDNHEQVEGEE